MPDKYSVLIAVEDLATAAIVAVEGARVAIEHEATELILLHVLNQHPVMGAVVGMGGLCAPFVETAEDADVIFGVARQALCAEYAAMGRAVPPIECGVTTGNVAAAIEDTASEHAVDVIVLGARRPHAFGRLAHPDVRAHVASHAPCAVHVAALQEMPAGSQA